MSRFFKPYEGRKPYLFISYSHRQSEDVVDTIRLLHEGGYRLWYDEGIPAGSDWPDNIARHMEACDGVLFFQSAEALRSPNCLSEIRTARRLNKPIQVVRLDDSAADAAWRDCLPEDAIPVLP
ncbi:MAG: toll/interleukin-1 receptor domain-containing protein, partial [Oscillospiraceae bacterium]|nr:toll/interleukin-1 receptor domain-containing protein [Oscillospiraceae bacterium]